MIESVCIAIPRDEQSQHLWNYSLLNFPPNRIFLLGDRDLWLDTKAVRRATSIQSLNELPKSPIVMMSPSRSGVPLDLFKHPWRATYLFGADDAKADPSWEFNHEVNIPTASDDEMFAAVAYAVTAWSHAHG